MTTSSTLTEAVESQVIQPDKPLGRPKQMLYEEYLAWVDEDTHSEWVNGEVILFMPPQNPHQTLVEFLHHFIGFFVEIFDLGRLRIAPFELKITPESNSREPDLMFITKVHLDRLTEARVAGPPDLIIEIVSTDSVHRDRVDKFDEYEAGGVLEYWIIDNRPRQQRAWFYQLDEHGRYQSVPVDDENIYHSALLPGFWLRLEWLWPEQPNVLRALAEVIGPEQIAQALHKSMDPTKKD